MIDNLVSLLLQAAPSEKWLFQSEKVYTVLTVVLLIWAGIAGYLVFTHLRLGKLEREVKRLAQERGVIVQDRGKGDIH